MVGAYIAFSVVEQLGSFWLALPIGIVAGLAFGAILERVLLARLSPTDHLSQVLLGFGLIILLNEGQRIVFGSDAHAVPMPRGLDWSITLGDALAYPIYRVFVCVLGIAFVAAIHSTVARTRIGMMLRAGAENRDMARALGVDVKLVYLGVTAVGVACAVCAGVIAAPLASVYPGMGDQILILSFVIIVLGGMGSVYGALMGAWLLALLDVFGKQYFPNYAAFVLYAAMILVLVARPQGLVRGTGA
jgi:branched-chain amino acid transport system permease protein